MWLYGFAKGIVGFGYRLLFRLQVSGLEHIPPDGGVIICGNHFTAHDPPVVAISANRPVSFMAKAELFDNKFLGWIFRGVGAFPVKRGAPDRAALKRSIDTLQEGRVFGIFPEGTRNRTGQLAKAEPGTAYLALKSGAPVVPVGITSSYKLFSPILVKFGPPVDLSTYRDGKLTSEALDGAGEQIMAAIGALLVPPVRPSAVAPGEQKT